MNGDGQTGATPAVVLAKVRRPAGRGLSRERLERLLEGLWRHRLTLVVAPAGYGKTTLLALAAEACGHPVAWYQPESADGDERTLLTYLWSAFQLAFGDRSPGPGWPTVEAAVADLEHRPPRPALLVVDDLHTVTGTEAEAALGRLVDYAPAWLHVAVGSRQPPGWNLPRRRVSGDLLELGPDELRFRPWEVERLFATFYAEPLPAEDVAELTRRTEGWAAGLQLFHLATRGKEPAERRRTLAALTTRSRLVREYLTRNVLEDLPAELRNFLVSTSVLGRLTGTLCDHLLGMTGSAALLDELHRRHLFLAAVDEEAYRCHEALRVHLEALLVQRVGEERARTLFARAATLLEGAGYPADALRAYCRAEDWPAVAAMLRHNGAELADRPDPWLDAIPAQLLMDDPGVLLAAARRHLASGRVHDALEAYRRAERAFGAAAAGGACRQERVALAAWVEGAAADPQGWTGLLRSALRHDPLGAESRALASAEPGARLAAGLAALLGGSPTRAADHLTEALAAPGSSPVVAAAARLALALVPRALPGIAGETASVPPNRPEPAVGPPPSPWLQRLGRAAAAVSGDADARRGAVMVAEEAERLGDPWGAALARYFAAVGELQAGGTPVAELEDVAGRLRTLGAATLAVWAEVGVALALDRLGDPRSRAAAGRAERAARSAAVRGARAVAIALLAGPGDGARAREATALAQACGFALARRAAPSPSGGESAPSPSGGESAPAVLVATLGGFRLEVGGALVDLAEVKPRARSALRLLAAWAGRPVHQEKVIAALWPEVEVGVGKRNLQVAVSSLRSLLAAAGGGGGTLLRREGSTYLLAVPAGSRADVVEVEENLARGRALRAHGDDAAARVAFAQVLEAYEGELLPEEGPAEWVVGRRRQLRADAVEAARGLAELALADGDAATAVAACTRGLEADRFDDRLWRLLVAASERAGDPAAAAAARRDYQAVLAELGVSAG